MATAYVERLLLMWRLLMWRGCPCGDSLRGEAVADVAIAYVERLPMWQQLMWRGNCGECLRGEVACPRGG